MEQNIQQNIPQTPHILYGNADNFSRVRHPNEIQTFYERPLCLDAWSQTDLEDFGLVSDDDVREREIQLKKENAILSEKIRTLENDLRVHSDLLISFNHQIQSTNALKTHVNRTSSEHISPTPPATPVMQQDQYNTQNYQQQIPRPNGLATLSYAASTSHLVNSLKTDSQNDSIKYTIVSNSNSNEQHEACEPIEIHLAEEDGALNLNNSADSGRLEICLNADEQQQHEHFDLKIETVKEEQIIPAKKSMPPQSGILVKRRKIVTQNGYEDLPTSSSSMHHNQYQYNQNGHETKQSLPLPSPSPQSTHYYETHQQTNKTDSFNSQKQQHQTADALRHLQNDNVMVSLGPNGTRVPLKIFESIKWENASASLATRKLLVTIFDRYTLATHSMTGKPSPAFKGQSKPQKKRLDPRVTADIVYVVAKRCKVSEKEVRSAITTKCADENKMLKQQLLKESETNNNDANKEN